VTRTQVVKGQRKGSAPHPLLPLTQQAPKTAKSTDAALLTLHLIIT